MRYTKLTAALPTRTTLAREVNARTLVAEYAASAAVVLVAVAAFVAGATTITVAVGVLLAALPAHPLALLVAVAATTVAFYALPLLAVRAATRAAVATE